MLKLLVDFDIKISKMTFIKILNKVQPNGNLSFEEFKQLLPLAALEFSTAMQKEIKYRLYELKSILEYPENKKEVSLTDEMLLFLNGVKQVYDHLGRKVKVDKECKVPLFV